MGRQRKLNPKDPESQARYARRRAAGLCGVCGKWPPMAGRALCYTCRESGRKRHGRWRGEVVKAYMCTRCGVHPIWMGHSATSCYACHIKRRTGERAEQVSAVRVYGGKCACCGLRDERFLTIDHVNNDGSSDRPGGNHARRFTRVYRDDIQVLCYNCNMGKERFKGVCPHKILAQGETWTLLKCA